MAPDPASGRRSVSPENSGRDSPIPRQWRNQLGGEDLLLKDKNFRKYAAGVEKALSLFETALEEWADYISFLNRLLKALQARPSTITAIPSRTLVAKRLAQCLDPSLPSGVHQKALEVYAYVFQVIGQDGLSRDLPLYLPGLASVLSFASLTVRSPYLEILERRFLGLDPRSLRPAMKSIILALLPGLEDETAEDFDRTLKLVASFKEAIRPADSELLTEDHATGDDYFWQCFFLASITSQGRRPGALTYLIRYLPPQGAATAKDDGAADAAVPPEDKVSAVVTSPEPGLLIRCFASGLSDDQLLIQRGFLDLLVTHLPLNSRVLRSRVKPADLELLLKAAVGVVTRRDMSLNRRLWAWFLGPEPASGDHEHSAESPAATTVPQQSYISSRTSYFEEFVLQPLTSALLSMIQGSAHKNPTERARPYRICLSLMDRWEIGGLVVPEVFLPVVENVRQFKKQASSKAEFSEVLRSASVFFDGIESGLIYGELLGQLAQALGSSNLSPDERMDKLSLVRFVLEHFNVREEEMITIHAPLSCLAALCMLQDLRDRRKSSSLPAEVSEQALSIAISLLELVPSRAFPSSGSSPPSKPKKDQKGDGALSNTEVLKHIKHFYVQEQGNLEGLPPPFNPQETGELLLHKIVQFMCDGMSGADLGVRILTLCLVKMPPTYRLDTEKLLGFLRGLLDQNVSLPFSSFTSIVQLSTELHAAERVATMELSRLSTQLVKHAWSYLSASQPKFHVETVRSLWQLQAALSLSSRDIEAALSTLIATSNSCDRSTIAAQKVDKVHRFSVLWSHTLQDSPSERRGSKTPIAEGRTTLRLSGMDHFEVMLTRPLFLTLDGLLDETTQQFMTVKSWLHSMIGIDRLFLIFVHILCDIDFLQVLRQNSSSQILQSEPAMFTDDNDLDLCLYYLQAFSNVLKYSGEVSRTVLATKHVTINGQHIQISTGGEEEDMTLQDFFVQVCIRCITGDAVASSSQNAKDRVSRLHRFALATLHQFFLSRHATALPASEIEPILLDRLAKSIESSDSYTQVLLVDVVLSTLRLRDSALPPPPPTPLEKRSTGLESVRGSRPSIAMSDTQAVSQPPPPQLLKCLQAALASPSSRRVLDSWISFLAECLPFYTDSIFQVLIPLVETLCKEIAGTFSSLRDTFYAGSTASGQDSGAPESTLIYLLNGLEQVLARSHDQLLAEEARTQLMKGPDQPQSIFGSMVSGVFQSDGRHSRSATANDRLTVHLAFQDATRMCYRIWSWGLGEESTQQDATSAASFNYTCLRMRNRARRLLEHLFTAETLECLETVIDIWKSSATEESKLEVFNLLSALEASRPRHTVPALFNSIYSRTNPSALEPSRKSTMTISVEDSDLVIFLVEYARSLDDDAMDEIWQDCIVFLKDLLSNPFPHRQNLTNLLEFTAILGEKVDNTNFGEQRKMRRELGDLFLKLLTALFTTRPLSFSESNLNGSSEKTARVDGDRRTISAGNDGPEEVVAVLASIVPKFPKVLVETDRILSAATSVSTNVIAPTIRSKNFPDSVSQHTIQLLHELSRLQNNQKTWKKDVGEALNDSRFFGMRVELVQDGWLPLLKQWIVADKDRMAEIINRITAPTTAGIVFGVGATSARLEADRKTQVNLRRIATIIIAAADDAFVADLPDIFAKLVELLPATATSSPSSATRGDIYMVIRALVLKTSPVHLAMLWPVVNAELHAAISSVVASDNSTASDTYANAAVLQACKLLDLLICVAPDDFQLHEWLFITDTIDAVHHYSKSQPVALVDELSEELGTAATSSTSQSASGSDASAAAHMVASSSHRRPLLGPGGLGDDVTYERRDELVAKILRPFFGQLSIFAFESTYAMAPLDRENCVQGLLKDMFDERSIARAL